jgi:hypothetical protein
MKNTIDKQAKAYCLKMEERSEANRHKKRKKITNGVPSRRPG